MSAIILFCYVLIFLILLFLIKDYRIITIAIIIKQLYSQYFTETYDLDFIRKKALR